MGSRHLLSMDSAPSLSMSRSWCDVEATDAATEGAAEAVRTLAASCWAPGDPRFRPTMLWAALPPADAREEVGPALL